MKSQLRNGTHRCIDCILIFILVAGTSSCFGCSEDRSATAQDPSQLPILKSRQEMVAFVRQLFASLRDKTDFSSLYLTDEDIADALGKAHLIPEQVNPLESAVYGHQHEFNMALESGASGQVVMSLQDNGSVEWIQLVIFQPLPVDEE